MLGVCVCVCVSWVCVLCVRAGCMCWLQESVVEVLIPVEEARVVGQQLFFVEEELLTSIDLLFQLLLVLQKSSH